MDCSLGKVKTRVVIFVVVFAQIISVNGYNTYTVGDSLFSYPEPHVVRYEHERVRRDASDAAPTTTTAAPVTTTAAAASNVTHNDTNRTTNSSVATTPPVASVTQTPLLGRNGTGIRHDVANAAPVGGKASEPILPEEGVPDMFKPIPDLVNPQENSNNLTFDKHDFYNSSFIGNATYFDEYWANITRVKPDTHEVLSNSHRRATMLKLTFDFPFYGHAIQNITVATGGFIYTGEHVHNWLAATQYIAPLMANFDTSLSPDSEVKMADDGLRFTAFWENVALREDPTKKFTFAVTLYKNGDIVFAYHTVPIGVQDVNDSEHPVKVGISDAYLADRIHFLVRRKTIYEYHRVSFKDYKIANKTILRLTALPTCLPYDTCGTCVNHKTAFDCMWCEAIRKCSSGTDRNKQDWTLRNCEATSVSNDTKCPAAGDASPPSDPANPAYITEGGQSTHITDVKPQANPMASPPPEATRSAPVSAPQPPPAHSAIGGVVAAFVAVALVCSLGAWLLYAFKNPHTRSGQLLIKYRPSQWSWRRGEARYTAATIHM